MNRKFSISFEELTILTSVTIPEVPIARTMFWHDMIDKYYHEMSREEADSLYEWISRNPNYQENIKKGNVDTLIFDARYNPDCQYKVTTNFEDEIEEHNVFLYNDLYYKNRKTSLLKEYITNIEKI